MSEHTLKNAENFIENVITQNKEIKYLYLSFFGGEPLLYFDKIVKSLMEKADEICKRNEVKCFYSFTPNGYLINSNSLEFFNKFDFVSFQITLDGGKEFHDKVRYVTPEKGSYERIIENIKSLSRIGCRVTVRINYTSENIDSVGSIFNDFKDLSEEERQLIHIDFHRVWQDSAVVDIDQKVFDAIKKLKNNSLDASKVMLDNVRYPCYADKQNGALINYNADVFRCSARDFANFPRDGYLTDNGDIVWENDSQNVRMDCKFKNAPCLECRILLV